ncbi:hypothetical protein GCM10017744_074820 [Streptomyces antimycoticus]|uniref:Uncharacterized protein n=1 Tax=Streptomyces antimycoticus TaxID=68175 RepID=A0A4D4JY97_9ACTN|nr:hypothetical protein SANT12839_026730 [Streptomyces antimycoticus]
MVARDLQIGDDQLVLQRTTDAHHPAGGELMEGGRAAVALGGRAAGRAGGAGAGNVLREVVLRGLGLLLRRLGCLLVLRLLMGRLLLRDERLLLVRGLGLLLGLRPALGLRRTLLRPALRRTLLRPAGAGLLRLLLGGGLLGLLGLLSRLGHAHRRLLAVRARGAHRGTAAGDAEPRAIGGIAEMDGRTRADFHLLDSPALHIGAVGGALILDDPTAPTPAHRGMPPGDPGVVQHHVALWVAPQAVRPGRIKCPGLSVQFQYEFRHSMPH